MMGSRGAAADSIGGRVGSTAGGMGELGKRRASSAAGRHWPPCRSGLRLIREPLPQDGDLGLLRLGHLLGQRPDPGHGREIDVRIAARRHLAHLLPHRLHGAMDAAHLVVLRGCPGPRSGPARRQATQRKDLAMRMDQVSPRVRRLGGVGDDEHQAQSDRGGGENTGSGA